MSEPIVEPVPEPEAKKAKPAPEPKPVKAEPAKVPGYNHDTGEFVL